MSSSLAVTAIAATSKDDSSTTWQAVSRNGVQLYRYNPVTSESTFGSELNKTRQALKKRIIEVEEDTVSEQHSSDDDSDSSSSSSDESSNQDTESLARKSKATTKVERDSFDKKTEKPKNTRTLEYIKQRVNFLTKTDKAFYKFASKQRRSHYQNEMLGAKFIWSSKHLRNRLRCMQLVLAYA